MEETMPRPSRGRARGERIKLSPTHPGDVSPTGRDGPLGSGSLLCDQMANLTLGKMMNEATSSSSPTNDSTGRHGAVPEKRKQHERNLVTRTMEMGSKRGSAGRQLGMMANYFRLIRNPDWTLYEHVVDFRPAEDSVQIRKDLVLQHRVLFGIHMFNGYLFYSIRNLGALSLSSVREMDDDVVEVTIRCVREVEPEDDISVKFYKILVNECFFAMNLEQVGRNYFDRHAAIEIPAHRITLWPGFVTTMRSYDRGFMLCVEVTHKIIRIDSVLTLINDMKDHRNFKAMLSEELTGAIVMTNYNRMTYCIDSIDWTVTPSDTFDYQGLPITYAHYYETRYSVAIKDLTQPMLVAQPEKTNARKAQMGSQIYLVPELCQITGLTDAMLNLSLKEDLSHHLQMVPFQRAQAIHNFIQRVQTSPELMETFKEWEMKFEPHMIECQGRVLPQENLLFAGPGKPEMVNEKADWTMALGRRKMLSTIILNRWIIVVPGWEDRGVENLLRTICNVAKGLNFMIHRPLEIVPARSPHPSMYLSAIDAAIKNHPDIQMLFVILPNSNHEVYSSVKKRLSVDLGIPSQCFLLKNLASKSLKDMATKIVIQMNVKLGGQPWSIQLQLENLMFVGFDVYKGAKASKGGSVGALVSTTSSNFASYFSTVSLHSNREELAMNLSSDIQKAVQAYQRKNSGKMPQCIVLFRDGVKDKDLPFVYRTELEQVKSGLESFYAKEGKPMPKLVFIVVTKKHTTRLFTNFFNNPLPGTVLDDFATLPERFDFFLVSYTPRRGSVTPASYNVIYNTAEMDADKIQSMTYKLCHTYFNWSGTVAVPAPCQYAHKLAALTGVSLDGKPAHPKLQHLLHFL